MAKEWACPVKKDGYANRYVLSLEGLKVMYLTRGGLYYNGITEKRVRYHCKIGDS